MPIHEETETDLLLPDAYEETSGTAGSGYGVRKGMPLGYISKAYDGISQKTEKVVDESINEFGEVMGE